MNPDRPMDPSHMDLDKYQQAWQTHSSETRVTVDADLLLKEVQRNQRDFRATIFRRDCVEVGVALLLVPYWLYSGVTRSLPWTWYLTIPAILWIGGFILVDRMRHMQQPRAPGEPLLTSVKQSLIQVEHQIWLLRNVFWWYLLPPGISILLFFAHDSWLRSNDWLEAVSHVDVLVIFLAICFFVFFLNQWAVRTQLEPRRDELLALLASLGDESADEHAARNRAQSVQSTRTLRRWSLVAASCLVTLVVIALAAGIFDSNYIGFPQSSGPAGDSLAKVIARQRKEKNLVGLATMVTVNGQVEAVAADGERKVGSGVPVEIGDRWHLGGIAKSMTATMIARLIESGKMQWSDTVGEVFPEASVHEDWKPVTLRQLLTDTAGAPANFPREVLRQRPPLGPESTQARREVVLNVLAEKPAYPPGTKYEYSNMGYTIAGAMAEKVTGATWEGLVEREVFEPLELTESGFGPPQSPDDTLLQPRGHRTGPGGKVAMNDDADNTTIMGPSAIVHMTLGDLCTYAEEHLRGNRGEGKLLSAETYKLLHTPEHSYYACGWIRKEPSAEIPHTLYWHNGSNTMWYALVVFIPDRNMVVAVTTNDGDIVNSAAATWEIAKASAEHPKTSPFAAVRWQESQPEVKVDGEWLMLVSLDELPAEEIVAFSQRTYEDKWQKRFEEDLVELLSRMGHPPRDTVKLVVQSLTSGETQVLEDVPMTEANRQAIRKAAQARVRTDP